MDLLRMQMTNGDIVELKEVKPIKDHARGCDQWSGNYGSICYQMDQKRMDKFLGGCYRGTLKRGAG